MKCYKIYLKNLKILFKKLWDEKFQNISEFTCWEVLREDVNFPNISEKCSNSYKNYEKNFHQCNANDL